MASRTDGDKHGFIDPARVRELATTIRKRADWEERKRAARTWSAAWKKTRLDKTKETSVQSTFLHRIFVDVLGFADQGSGASEWTVEPELSTDVDATHPDASLGHYTATGNKTLAVVELKDALTDLDAKQMSRSDRLSPVEQAFLYLLRFDHVQFALVSNFRSMRLYSRRFGMLRYHSFDMPAIGDPDELSRCLALCSAPALVGDATDEAPPLLAEVSHTAPRRQQDITAAFYKEFASHRDSVVKVVLEDHPDERQHAIEHAQKLLDRVLFIAYAEDIGLLPRDILQKTMEAGMRSRSRSQHRIWQELRFLFADVDKGRADILPAINRYNGGLFAPDLFIDGALQINDELAGAMCNLGSYDFTTALDVTLLGSIFERSLADVSTIRAQLNDSTETFSPPDIQRKSLGIFYTADWVTAFLTDQTIGRILQEEGPEARTAITVLDPACGSGAFLSEALSYLHRYSKSVAVQLELQGDVHLYDNPMDEKASAHLPQLYGVDILAEAVEITRLALWLKSADRDSPLDTLPNVFCANPLLPQTDNNSYEDRQQAIRLERSAFKVVLGNPPWGAEIDYPLRRFRLTSGQVDTYELFLERALEDFVEPGGYLGFVIPDRILRPEGKRIRKYLFDNFRIFTLLKLGEGVFEGVFRAAVAIVIKKELPIATDTFIGGIITKDDREALSIGGVSQLTTILQSRGGSVSRNRVIQDPEYGVSLAPDLDIEIVEQLKAGSSAWTGPAGIFDTHGRGEELGADSFLVQCPACYHWSINPRRRAKKRGGGYESKHCEAADCDHEFTVDKALDRLSLVSPCFDPADDDYYPIYFGDQVNRYWLDSPWGMLRAADGFRYKPDSLYSAPKILIRQTGIGIYATIDRSDARCSQSVYVYGSSNASPNELEFYLAQLCSRSLLFYYFISTNQVEWQSFPKLTHNTLQQFPLIPARQAGAARLGRVGDLVRKRLHLAVEEDGGYSAESDALELEIESLVMDAHDLTPTQRARINDRLQSASNIRIVRELYRSRRS